MPRCTHLFVIKPILVLLIFLHADLFGQGVINVNNRGLSSLQLVRDVDGNPLVGTNFVAQIVYGNDQELGPPMPFRSVSTSSPGTWDPKPQSLRILQGVSPGSYVELRVWVWNSSFFSSRDDVKKYYENMWFEQGELPEGDYRNIAGISSIFTCLVGNTTNSSPISNFQGFSLLRPYVVTLGTRVFSMPENGSPLFIPESSTYFLAFTETHFPGVPDFNVGTVISTNGGYFVVPRPDVFGTVYSFSRNGVVNRSPVDSYEYSGRSRIQVTPSPRRPFLDFSRTNSSPLLVMRGLPPTRYRIEGSTNLVLWSQLGELTMEATGNAAVPPEWISTNDTQFVRFKAVP